MKNFCLLLLLTSATLFSQSGGKFEKIKSLKTAFITEQLALTPTEAEKFWPVYNVYDSQFRTLNKNQRKEIFDKVENGTENMTNAEATVIIDKDLEIRSKELELRKQMVTDLGKILSAKKILLLAKSEEDFKRTLLHRYRDAKQK